MHVKNSLFIATLIAAVPIFVYSMQEADASLQEIQLCAYTQLASWNSDVQGVLSEHIKYCNNEYASINDYCLKFDEAKDNKQNYSKKIAQLIMKYPSYSIKAIPLELQACVAMYVLEPLVDELKIKEEDYIFLQRCMWQPKPITEEQVKTLRTNGANVVVINRESTMPSASIEGPWENNPIAYDILDSHKILAEHFQKLQNEATQKQLPQPQPAQFSFMTAIIGIKNYIVSSACKGLNWGYSFLVKK